MKHGVVIHGQELLVYGPFANRGAAVDFAADWVDEHLDDAASFDWVAITEVRAPTP